MQCSQSHNFCGRTSFVVIIVILFSEYNIPVRVVVIVVIAVLFDPKIDLSYN